MVVVNTQYVQVLKDQIMSKDIGRFIHMDIIMSKGLAFKSEYPGSWRADGKYNLHNILDANTIHYIDLLISLQIIMTSLCLDKVFRQN